MKTKTKPTKAKKKTEEKPEKRAITEVAADTKKVVKKLPDNPNMKWYVVNSYVGQEKKVAGLIKQRVKTVNMKHKVGRVVVPTHEKVSIQEGKKKSTIETIFPGYILVKMELTKETWPLVRDTPGVTGFSGTARKPTPLSKDEVTATLKFMKVKQPTFKTSLAKDDAVEVTGGADEAFKGMNGTILEVDEAKGKAKVMINIFGRETPVELDIEKLKKL